MREYAAKQNGRPKRFDRIIKKLRSMPKGTILNKSGLVIREGDGTPLTQEQRDAFYSERKENELSQKRRTHTARRNAERLAKARKLIADCKTK